MKKQIVISWESRLDDLYHIAGNSGACSENCEVEWLDWCRGEYDRRFYDVEIEPIPADLYEQWLVFADTDEEE